MEQQRKKTIKKELTVQASPVVVWETLTTNRGMESFFAREVDLDVREGGRATFRLSDSFSYSGLITKVIPLQTLVWEETLDKDVTTVEWTLSSEDGGKTTNITMVSSGFVLWNEGVQWGWETVMRVLKWSVEEGFRRTEASYLGIKGGLIGMGFQIYDVVSGSPADIAGLKVGDRIQGVGNHSLCGIGWVADVLHQYQPGIPTEVRVVRAGDWIPESIMVTPSAWYLEMGEYDLI